VRIVVSGSSCRAIVLVAVLQPRRDGSLLVSDDGNGVIYRITYEPK
jgi:glucose/arabinose dehydrogenase